MKTCIIKSSLLNMEKKPRYDAIKFQLNRVIYLRTLPPKAAHFNFEQFLLLEHCHYLAKICLLTILSPSLILPCVYFQSNSNLFPMSPSSIEI